jgi:O-6-methylguanine DNA methyltransferase
VRDRLERIRAPDRPRRDVAATPRSDGQGHRIENRAQLRRIAGGRAAPAAARAVGQALGKNPVALIIPCHRILAAGGKPGGFSTHGGLATKAWMLAVEGAAFGSLSPSS